MAVTYKAGRGKPIEFVTPKDPSDVVVYTFDWSGELGANESLSTRTVTVDTGLTKDSDEISGSNVNVTVSGGTAGKTYTVACLVTTDAGRTMQVSALLKVRNR